MLISDMCDVYGYCKLLCFCGYINLVIFGCENKNRFLVLGSLVQVLFPFQLREGTFHLLLCSQKDVGFMLHAR